MFEIEGPQRLCIPDKMAYLYKEIYNKLPKKYNKNELSQFFPACGCLYRNADPKIMIVGRCVNGWGELTQDGSDCFVRSAAEAVTSAEGFAWINKDNHISTYTDENNNLKEYNINKSAFWRLNRKIFNKFKPWVAEYLKTCEISEEHRRLLENMDVERWFDYIVWTNLYPIAPKSSGNAYGELKDFQNEFASRLVVEQIKYYKPKYAIFVTDWDYWFSDFSKTFCDVNKIDNGKYVVGKGNYNGAKIVVTVRPDRTKPHKPNEDEMADEIFINLK